MPPDSVEQKYKSNHMSTKKFLSIVVFLFLSVITLSSNAQQPVMKVSDMIVTIGKDEFKGPDFNIHFSYGSWSPSQTLYNNEGLVITASFKLATNNTARSEVKNSSLRILVKYTAIYMGEKREKTTEQIKYLDAERKFSTGESFSFKPTRYDIRIVKINFNGELTQ
jgi:hypothetical protein